MSDENLFFDQSTNETVTGNTESSGNPNFSINQAGSVNQESSANQAFTGNQNFSANQAYSPNQGFTQNQEFTRNQEFTQNSGNSAQAEYSFWAEQAATNHSQASYENSGSQAQNTNRNFNYNYYSTNEQAASDIRTEHKEKKHPVRRVLGFIAKAAIFGIIASAAFVGYNKVYLHFFPEEYMGSAYHSSESSGNSKLNLDSPGRGNELSTTTVSEGVKINSADVSDLVENTMTATVAISSYYNSSYYIWGQEFNQESEGGGSGIIIGQTDTELLIATNNHVVEDTTKLVITFIDETTAEGTIKGRDSGSDLAVVSVDISTLSDETLDKITVAKLGDSDSVKVGQMVVAIGNALGYGQSVTVGYISAKNREITLSRDLTMTVLQTDAAINPGNSGGALVNMNGEVIGINSAKIGDTDVEGIGYAIPISNALPIVNNLMTREILSDEEKGYLGVYFQNITQETAATYNWPVGVYVYDIVEGGAAGKAGILKGDIITAINGITMTSGEEMKEYVNSYRYGTTVTVTLQRIQNGSYEEMTIDVVLQPSADTSSSDSEDADTSKNSTAPKGDSDNSSELPEVQPEQPENDTPNIDSPFEVPEDGSNPESETDPLQDFLDRFFH